MRQVAREPELRKWLIGRFLRQYPAEPGFNAHQPPYVDHNFTLEIEKPVSTLEEFAPSTPTEPIELPLAGYTVVLRPGEEKDLFQRSFEDIETVLSLHRFAWLPILGEKVETAWVAAIWSAWKAAHAAVDGSWAWHPYTASERAINVINFAEHRGLPFPRQDTLQILALHGPAIAGKLEYFGDHHTSNHLANNGRGLFILGLALNLPACIELGATILIEEAKRIFSPSGMLREGSSHYHLLLARNYRIAAETAERYNHSAYTELSKIVRQIYAPLPYLKLPGGMPLVGDISPDLPPEQLASEFYEVLDREPYDSSKLEADGWLRYNNGPWSGLWHMSPEGWSHMPGHGHQDCGSFELHYEKTPIFVDPGRGAYGEEGEAALYRSAAVHNTLTVDGYDPYPPNKPYFDDKFRTDVGGPSPMLEQTDDGVCLRHQGYSRFNAVGELTRKWAFSGKGLSVEDCIGGTGRRKIRRILCSVLPVTQSDEGLILGTQSDRFLMKFDNGSAISLSKGKRWTAYGVSEPAVFISVEDMDRLPWQGRLTLEKIAP